jgi:hypothetical protein
MVTYLKSWMLGNTEGDDQYFGGDLCPYIFIGFVSLSALELHSCTTNTGRSIKEADSVGPWMNRLRTDAAWCISCLNDQAGFVNSPLGKSLAN